MAMSWEALAARPGCLYSVEDFESAGYQLVTSQILYESDSQQRLAYQIVSLYRAQYRERLSELGLNVDCNEVGRFCYAVPKRPPRFPLPLTETLLVLVLRSIFHNYAMKAELVDGCAEVGIEELLATYKDLTGRELPTSVGELRELIQTMKRFGLAKLGEPPEGDPQPFVITVLPGIDVLVNESWLTRLAAYKEGETPAATEEPHEPT